MRFKLTALAAYMALSAPAHAVEVFGSIAATKYERLMNGIWYQEGFPYHLDLETIGWSVGVSGKPSGWPRLQVEYIDMGFAKADALAVGDANYNPTEPDYCNGTCEIPARYVSKGKVRGVALVIAPEFGIGNGTFYLEGGLFFYKPTYEILVTGAYQDILGPGNGVSLYARHDADLERSYTIGAGYRYKSVSVGWRWMPVMAGGDDFPAIYDEAHQLYMRVYF